MKEEIIKDKSFGQIQFSKVVGGSSKFYGSNLTTNSYIQLTISQSEMIRSLTDDKYYPRKKVIEVSMTNSQFAELITSLNFGGGVPCTIRYNNGEVIEHTTISENRKDFVVRKFKEKMKTFSFKLKEYSNNVGEILKKGKLSVSDKEEINRGISNVVMETENNIPFYLQCFQEAMEDIVIESKHDVEASILHKITSAGLDALTKEKNNKPLNK